MKKKFFVAACAATMVMGCAMTANAADKEDEFSVLETYNSVDVSSNAENDQYPYVIDEVSTETGLSISFTLDTAMTDDWDTVLASYDWTIQQTLTLINYTTDGWASRVNVFEAAATPSAYATEYMSSNSLAPWQLFLNTTSPMTVSFTKEGDVKWYLDGHLMLTYDSTTACGEGTVADYVDMVIDAVKTDGIMFTVAANNVSFGYGVGYTPDASQVDPSVYAQYKKETDGEYTVRVVAEVEIADLDSYAGAGFRCTKTAQATASAEAQLSTVVFKSIMANGSKVEAADGNYFIVTEIQDVPADGVVYVRPSYTLVGSSDGAKDFADKEYTINMANIVK